MTKPRIGARAQTLRLEPVVDKRAFKLLLHAMSAALRDSHGGGIVERFDVISKLLFLKLFDEREVAEQRKGSFEFQVRAGDGPQAVAKRVDRLWLRARRRFPFLHSTDSPRFSRDSAAISRIVQLLQMASLRDTPGDIKGLAYEEILRNTFDKNDNQQFFTPHEIVEFMVHMVRPSTNDTICDPACGTGGFLVETLKFSGVGSRLVGVEVDARLACVAQMNLVMHGAEHATVSHLPGRGSLAPLKDLAPLLSPGSLDVILTNPPFGSDLADREALDAFRTGNQFSSRRRSVLFTERCLELLKPGGVVGIVLDDSVLNLSGNRDIRMLLQSQASIEAIISLPDVTFMPYSSAKASIVIARKRGRRPPRRPVFMGEATQVGRRPNGDPLYSDYRDGSGNRQLLSDLPELEAEYHQFRSEGSSSHPKCFAVNSVQLKDRLDVSFYHPKRFMAERELANCRWPTLSLREVVLVRRNRSKSARDFGDSPVRWLGLADIEERSGDYDIKVVTGAKIRSQANVFKGGDILFACLRPNLRKVVLITLDDEGGICSGEIMVMRVNEHISQDLWSTNDGPLTVDPRYLTFLLRSDLVYGQLLAHVTGVGRPRISPQALLDIRIPVPKLEEQQRIIALIEEACKEAANARQHATKILSLARQRMDSTYETAIAELTGNGQP